MHEMAIIQSVVSMVEEAAAGRRVRVVTLEVGALSGVSPDALAFSFDLVIEGTALDGARLDIRNIPGRARCLACGAEFETRGLAAACPCGSPRLVRLCGEELNVKSLELEEAA
ncbi:MAG: hydrogenase maturation nickel metallochaperone HypA [Caulobacteraceae bacterium]